MRHLISLPTSCQLPSDKKLFEFEPNLKVLRSDGHSSGNHHCPSESPVATDGRNPMLNAVVLMRLFKFCDLSDLPYLRLVCKQWYSLTLSRFRKDMIVEIHEEPVTYDLRGVCQVPKRLQWKNVGDKLDVGAPVFSRFRLVQLELCEVGSDNVSNFWRRYGHTIHQLELIRCTICSVDTFKTAIFEKTPNMKKLVLDRIETNGVQIAGGGPGEVVKIQRNLTTLVVGTYGGFPVTWSLLFAHFPNIQKAEFRHYSSWQDDTRPVVLILEPKTTDETRKWVYANRLKGDGQPNRHLQALIDFFHRSS